jgi:hypothetical protein
VADEPMKVVIDCAAAARALPAGVPEKMGEEAQRLWWEAQQSKAAAEQEPDESKAGKLREQAEAQLVGAEELATRIREDEELKASGAIEQVVPLNAEELEQREADTAAEEARLEAEDARQAEREEMVALADKVESGAATEEEVNRALAFALRRG